MSRIRPGAVPNTFAEASTQSQNALAPHLTPIQPACRVGVSRACCTANQNVYRL